MPREEAFSSQGNPQVKGSLPASPRELRKVPTAELKEPLAANCSVPWGTEKREVTQDSSGLASSEGSAVRDGWSLSHSALRKALSGSISSLFPNVLHQNQQVSPYP